MVRDLRVVPETAPPSFEKGIPCMTRTTVCGPSSPLFCIEKGLSYLTLLKKGKL
jgi:hypothetical protein